MNYEEKYKEIVGQLKKAYLYAQTDSTKAVLEEILPELAESEDEKIRKELIDIVEKSPITFAFEDKGKVLAWLEKQGEQKPAWSEEDEKMMNSFLHKVEVCNLLTNKENVWIINKLKSLKQRIGG